MNVQAQSLSLAADGAAATVPPQKIAVIGIRGLPANYGGLETCADEVCRRWADAGHDVLVYCRRGRYSERPDAVRGVSLRYLPSLPSKSLDTISHTFLCVLDLLFVKRRYRNVHLYNTGNSIFIPLLRLGGRHVVLSGDGIEWKRQKWGRLARFVHKLGEQVAARFANDIVVDNEEVGAYYRAKFDIPTTLIAYGANEIAVDPEHSARLLARHGLEAGRYFLFVGRIVPEKGVHELIEAYRSIRTDYPLVIIGDDSPKSEYRNAVFAAASERVRLLGFVYDEDYEQLLVNAAMYLSASRLEGTSPSLLAAMGAGVCCLVNGIPENRATVKGSVPTYAENDLADLVAKWQALVDDPDEARAVAESGRECVRRHYSWDAVADGYFRLFDRHA
ncbi:MAG TPA: glycosyltransferase [Woeseiaceae bacterium]|nr:glycosyltransferase [Woeseiaceae bacterium]